VIAALLLLVLFLLISDVTRTAIFKGIGDGSAWFTTLSPGSQMMVEILAGVIVVGLLLMLSWPKTRVPRTQDHKAS
jgi:hypothetical protein